MAAPASPALDMLPAEVSEQISEHLDLHAIQSLRLTSTKLWSAYSQQHFKTFFVTRSVTLGSRAQLRRLACMVAESSLGRALQRLSVLVHEIDPLHDSESSSALIELLAVLAHHMPDHRLPRLTLEMPQDIDRRPDAQEWQDTSLAASHAFRLLVTSLSAGAFHLQSLDIFYSGPGSISLDTFGTVATLPRLSILTQLCSLNLSISNSLPGIVDEANSSLVQSKNFCQDLCAFIDRCSQIQHLGLHWYSLQAFTQPDTDALDCERDFLACLSSGCPLSNLQSLSIKGLVTTEPVLSQLVKNKALHNLEMVYIRLYRGSFRPVLDTVAPTLNSLRLSELHEKQPICFESSREPFGETAELFRTGEHTRARVDYFTNTRKVRGEVGVFRAMKQRQVDYGPPPSLSPFPQGARAARRS